MVMFDLTNDEHMILLSLVDIKMCDIEGHSDAYCKCLNDIKKKLEVFG